MIAKTKVEAGGSGSPYEVDRFNRRVQRPMGEHEKAIVNAIKAKAEELEHLYARLRPGRYNALAITALEESVMWIVKEATS